MIMARRQQRLKQFFFYKSLFFSLSFVNYESVPKEEETAVLNDSLTPLSIYALGDDVDMQCKYNVT